MRPAAAAVTLTTGCDDREPLWRIDRGVIMRHVSTFLLGVLLLGSAGVAPPAASHAQTPWVQPRFEPARCPFTPGPGMVVGRTVRCGYLVVPAHRGRPHG